MAQSILFLNVSLVHGISKNICIPSGRVAPPHCAHIMRAYIHARGALCICGVHQSVPMASMHNFGIYGWLSSCQRSSISIIRRI